MNDEADLTISMPDDRTIVHTRVFAAPRARVFAALTEPDLLRRWYGPPGWSLVGCESDLRAGGRWRFTTRKPDGREIVQQGTYVEVAPPARLVKTERWADWDAGEVHVTTDLEEADGRTTLTVTTLFPSRAVRDELLARGASAHARAHYEKLAAVL